MDQSAAIQETLEAGEKCRTAVECVLRRGWRVERRLVGLVRRERESALFLFSHLRMAISAEDVWLEEVVPVSRDFSVAEAPPPDQLAVVGADTRVRVCSGGAELEMTLPFGSHSRHFLEDVTQAWSDVCEQREEPEFHWLQKYKRTTRSAGSPRISTEGAEAWAVGGAEHSQVRDGLVRSATPVPAHKAQVLAMPQFGLRDNLIRCELLKSEDTYTYLRGYRFFLGTYNVNGQNPKESLRPWLATPAEPPDFYLIGFQELDLSKEAFLFNDTPRELEWSQAVCHALHPDAKYALVKLVRLVGIMLLFYVKSEHAAHVSQVEAESVGTGVMGRMGNKGAVAVRFLFHHSDVCVVNAHLAAHTDELQRRNQDVREICRRVQFRPPDPSLPPLSIAKHSAVLWLGDLNYRISDLELDHVKQLIANNDFQTLYNYDQLKRQMDEELVFVGFTEGEIDFQPTYKYDTGTDQWDTSEKSRVPAWCDRILWRGKNIRQLSYTSHMTLKTSDHKPVSSLLEIQIKVVNEELYKRTFEEIVRHLDRLENDCIPSVSLSQTEFHFEDVKFMQHQVRTLRVHNDGLVPCQFEFIQKLDEPLYCKPWLTASPAKGFLAQGGAVDIDLEVFVNRWSAPGLNAGLQRLEDILVLHLERGKDFFISVSGSYLPSCFGSPLTALCELRGPVRGERPDPSDTPQEIPKELWRMVDHLYRHAQEQEDLFQQPGLRSEFEEIRDCLDTGSLDTLPGSNHSVAEALLLFLDALPEPVMPFSFYQQCLDNSSSASQCRQIVSSLPPSHRNVFNYLTAFLQEMLRHSPHNRLGVAVLAPVFAGILLRSPTRQNLQEKSKTREFITHFLLLPPTTTTST